MMKLSYLPPTEHIKKYARELNLKLLEPYSVRDEERAGIAQANVENEALRKRIADQEKEMEEIKEMMKQFLSGRKPESLKEFVCQECGQSFDHLIALTGHKRMHTKTGSG